MKPNIDTARDDARRILAELGIAIDQDSDTLRSWQVERLLEFADLRRYRKPKNANGSRARYFLAHLQRRARNASAERIRQVVFGNM